MIPTIAYAESCNCKQNEVFPDGNLPEYFTDEKLAARAFVLSKAQKLYFGVHLNNKHILTVHIKGFCPCKDCKS